MADLLEFSKTVSLSKIPDYIKEKKNEKLKLEEEIEKLKAQIGTLREQKEDAELLRDIALEDARITSFKLKWYSDLKAELGKYGIPAEDISKLAKLVDNTRQSNYDVKMLMNELSNLEGLRLQHQYLQETMPSLEDRSNNLKRECSTLETMIAVHNQVPI